MSIALREHDMVTRNCGRLDKLHAGSQFAWTLRSGHRCRFDAWMQFSRNLVRNRVKTAARLATELAQADAPYVTKGGQAVSR